MEAWQIENVREATVLSKTLLFGINQIHSLALIAKLLAVTTRTFSNLQP